MNISVLIPVYNAGSLIQKAVESALQFPEVKEVVLVEDGSKDNSLEACLMLQEKYPIVKVFQHPNGENRGAGATRNLGIDKVTQDYIAFLDADDVFTHLRFTAEKEHFKNPKVEGVFGAIGLEFLSEKGKKQYQEKFKDSTLTTVNYPTEGMDVFEGLMLEEKKFGVFFSLIGLTVKKSAIDREKLRFNENLRVHQDMDFIRKLSYHCHLKTGIIDKAVSLRGVHDDNRITKIKQYSSKFYQNQHLLYSSTHQWASQEKDIPKKIKQHIKLRHLSFKIANQKSLKKYVQFALSSLLNPLLLKTKYRFHALNKHHNVE